LVRGHLGQVDLERRALVHGDERFVELDIGGLQEQVSPVRHGVARIDRQVEQGLQAVPNRMAPLS
jgi:hypothetical protein